MFYEPVALAAGMAKEKLVVGGRWRVVRVTAKLTPLILAARDSSDEANARPKTMTKPVAQTRAQKSHSKRHCYEVKRAKKKAG